MVRQRGRGADAAGVGGERRGQAGEHPRDVARGIRPRREVGADHEPRCRPCRKAEGARIPASVAELFRPPGGHRDREPPGDVADPYQAGVGARRGRGGHEGGDRGRRQRQHRVNGTALPRLPVHCGRESDGDRIGGRVPVLPAWPERPLYDVVNHARNPRPYSRGPRPAVARRVAGEHVEGQRADRVDIGADVDATAWHRLLRGHDRGSRRRL